MAENKKKCRQYNATYINYGFIPSATNVHLPMCLLCQQVFSNEAMKPSRQSGLVASYNIALLITKADLPFTVGESLVIPAIMEAISTVMQCDPAPVTKAIPLSNDSVARRIREMSTDTEEQLCLKLRGCTFSVQLDETTTADNNVLLMAYVRYVSGRDLVEDFLFGEYLATDTRGETIFAALTKRGHPGDEHHRLRHRWSASYVHCVLHRHNLVAKKLSPSLHQSLDVAVKAINKIKAHALNDRLFRQLCGENDDDELNQFTSTHWSFSISLISVSHGSIVL
ncbi:SCAN domain-containing protein 3 [Merluccius polli]|uniref:SCAN domain-containing protein 3 n=1 Tax=Merluccius polli TaxID=89951 RepID=A0AA47NLK5_MERPO|nr:SCAN domain-containing protein 3 [Merluccius polli]KAK0148596.1 SCAN domain-containing protein 3 [Merluccius polli]